jgi:hypothetical protein
MRLKNKMWIQGSATIYDHLLHPTDDTAVARVFIAPESGDATVYGTIRMFEEAMGSVKISIYHNETKIYPETGERTMNGHDTTGYFHRHQVQLVSGDRLTFLVETDDGTSGNVSWNPVVDYLNLEEEYLHYAMTDYVGDVIMASCTCIIWHWMETIPHRSQYLRIWSHSPIRPSRQPG